MMASNRTPGKKKKKKIFNSPPSPRNFQFINFTDAPHVDEYDRDVIRTQAISDYHHRKRNNNPRTSDTTVSQVAKGSTSTFRLLSHPQGRDTRRPPRPAQNISQGSRLVGQGFSQTSPDWRQNIAQLSSSDHIILDDSPRCTLATVDNRMEQREPLNDQTPHTTFQPRSKQGTAEELINKLDLLAINMDPLLNLPVTASDRIRLWIHHYCKRSFSQRPEVLKRKIWI